MPVAVIVKLVLPPLQMLAVPVNAPVGRSFTVMVVFDEPVIPLPSVAVRV